MKTNWYKQHVPACYEGIVVCAVMLLVAPITPGYIMHKASGLQRQGVLEKISSYPDLPVLIDTSEGSSLLIQTATAKQISGVEYEQLTGAKPVSNNYVTYPNVKLINNTNKRVVSFSLGFFNKNSGSMEVIELNRQIEPFKEMNVNPKDWASPKNAGVKKITLKDGVAYDHKDAIGLDSEMMWLAGSLTDFTVLVGHVQYEDGSKWTPKH